MQSIKHTNGVIQSKEDFLIQELNGLIVKAKLVTSNDIEEINYQRARVAMLESLVEDCYRRIMADS